MSWAMGLDAEKALTKNLLGLVRTDRKAKIQWVLSPAGAMCWRQYPLSRLDRCLLPSLSGVYTFVFSLTAPMLPVLSL